MPDKKEKESKEASVYDAFFYPENIAVIGVSPRETNFGKNIVFNLLTFGYRGEIVSVGPTGGVVFGQRIYRTLSEIDHAVDMAVILTPADTIPSILEECGRKGISRAVIESGGFSEMGKDRVPIEKACMEIAEKYGIRFIGPNGIGIINMENGLAVPFMPLRKDVSRGKVSILAQSGGVGLSYINLMSEENIGLNKFVSMGNKLNVDENDLLSYLIDDPSTEIILVYLEGFKNARRFMEIASRSEKPILVHKSNRFRTSASIARSHTTALFTDDRLVDHALKQAGCVRVNTLSDALDYIKVLTLPRLKGTRLAIVSRSGGHAVIAADACGHYGFELPPLPEEFLSKVEGRVRANVIRLQNPLDLGDLFDLTFYENIIEELLSHEDVDAVLLGHGYRRGYEQEDSRALIDRVERLMRIYQKPVAVFIFTEAAEMAYLKSKSRIPVFSTPESAIRAIHFSYEWNSRKRGTRVREARGEKAPRAENILKEATGRGYLFLDESLDLLDSYGFPVPAYHLAKTAEEALSALESIGGPCVMKINRPHISHKSEGGFVKIDLQSRDDVIEVFESFKVKIPGEEIEVLLQPMIRHGQELILGGKRDDAFGPVVLFGLGGIFVEALGDVVWRLAPIDAYDAREMIKGIKGKKILEGIRGEAPSDTEAIEHLLLRLSRLLVDLPMIKEIDINPLKVAGAGQGAKVLDARVVLG